MQLSLRKNRIMEEMHAKCHFSSSCKKVKISTTTLLKATIKKSRCVIDRVCF